jgi:hypothetical protein
MKKTLTFCQFCDEFPEDRREQFTYEGKQALFDWLCQYEEETGEEVECDIIGFCCEFTEYASADEGAREFFEYEGMEFGEDGEELLTVEEVEAKAIKFLEYRTTVIPVKNGGVIIQNV